MAWFFRNWRSDDRGSVLPIAAVAILLSAALIGSGVDLSRAYRAKNRLQSACDAAVLAGRRAETSNGFDDSAQTQAENFFNANFSDERQDTHDTSFEPYSDNDGETVKGVARTKSANLLMSLFGFEEVALEVECQASMGIGNSDVVMVLDTTASMNFNMDGFGDSGERMAALKDAMKNFYVTLENATNGTNARVRYGFVPYASSVNIGRLLYETDPSYIADSWEYPSRKPIYRIETTQTLDHYGNPVITTGTSSDQGELDSERYGDNFYWRRSDCQSELPSATSWEDASPTTETNTYFNDAGQRVTVTVTTQRQTRKEYYCASPFFGYRPYVRTVYRDSKTHQHATQDPVYVTTENRIFERWSYEQVIHPTDVFKSGLSATLPIGESGGQPSNMTSRWNGCVQAVKTSPAETFTYSSLNGMQPSDAYDLDIDHVPGADPDTKWGPMWPEVTYKRTEYISRNWYLKQDASYNGVSMSNPDDVVCPKEAQLLSEMEQSDFNAYADALTPKGGTYLDVGLIWGGRLLSEDGVFANNVKQAPDNGGEVSRHLIFMTDGEMSPNINTLTAYGIEYFDRKTTPDDESYGYVLSRCCASDSDDRARHSERFLAVCKAIKAKGIRLWTIAFTKSSTTNLDTCASDNSSYSPEDAEELDEAFQEIAKQVGELRIIE
ncbi:TadE/TadG family type IV pilus assembly protein [Novosphingobium aquimarinum]|uniref:TadE/TadG family type IV pilus assembly protein n=1 Tax=Novosphingobium aquimarinum TaxID=2682494 RepID=UPI0012EB2911|nr:TadE/TadG family type IV pilus assembly protein [Novosphingobium aquimarinum]